MSVESLTAAQVRDFARERDWEQFHTPKNLAMALSGEASERGGIRKRNKPHVQFDILVLSADIY